MFIVPEDSDFLGDLTNVLVVQSDVAEELEIRTEGFQISSEETKIFTEETEIFSEEIQLFSEEFAAKNHSLTDVTRNE